MIVHKHSNFLLHNARAVGKGIKKEEEEKEKERKRERERERKYTV